MPATGEQTSPHQACPITPTVQERVENSSCERMSGIISRAFWILRLGPLDDNQPLSDDQLFPQCLASFYMDCRPCIIALAIPSVALSLTPTHTCRDTYPHPRTL